MNSSKFTDFGLAVKMELLQKGKSQGWLISEVKSHSGMFVDDSYIYKILTGQRAAPQIVRAICEVLGLPEPDAADMEVS